MCVSRTIIIVVVLSAFCVGIEVTLATPPNVKVNSDTSPYLQNEEQIWISPNDANVVIADWRDWRLGYRRVGIGVSTDGGATWEDSLFTDVPHARQSDPCLVGDRYGDFYACMLNYKPIDDDSSFIVVYRSTDNGSSWSGPVLICDWEYPHFEDKQMTAMDRTGGVHDGNYYVSWARFPHPTRIIFARSTDGTQSFDDTLVIGEPVLYDGEPWSVGNFSMPVVDADGDVHVLWLGYRVVNDVDIYYAIRYTGSTDGGQTFCSERVVVPTTIGWAYVDGDVDVYGAPIVDCDMSGGPYNNTMYFAQTQHGSYYFEGSDDMEIAVWKSTDKGNTWVAPVMVNDDPVGMYIDQFHPWLVVNEDGIVLVIFYDQRNDPVGHYLFDAYFSASFDGAETFIHNMRISDVSINPDYLTIPKGERPEVDPDDPGRILDPAKGRLSPRAGKIAEYIGIHANNDTVSTIWTDTRSGNQDCYSARFIIPFQAPRLYLPEDGAVNQGNYPSFRWSTCWHESEDVYRLEISTVSDFLSIEYLYDGLTDNNFTVTTEVDSTQVLYWRVKAFRADGDSTEYSETRSFGGSFPAPQVDTVFPNKNEVNVMEDANIEVVFDIDIDPLTVDYTSFAVYGSECGFYAGTYSYDAPSRTAEFDASDAFRPGELITVVVTEDVESANSITLDRSYTWSFTIRSAAAPAAFRGGVLYPVGDAPNCICAADLDNDGDVDVAASNYLTDDVSVLLNNGDGTFAGHDVYSLHTKPLGIGCADLDRDGFIDLAIANRATDSVSILLNVGDGTFTFHEDLLVNERPFYLVLADLNGDGAIDLATTHPWSSTVEIHFNDGSAGFDSDSVYVVDADLEEICAGDLDLDADIDLAVAVSNETNEGVYVLLNNGDGIFNVDAFYAVESAPQSVAVIDVDFDSDLDLIASNRLSSVVSVLKNTGDGTFAPQSTYWAGDANWDAVPADLDGDLDPDIVTSLYNFPERMTVLHNDGTGLFYSFETFETAYFPFDLCPADYDNDGDIDIAATAIGGDGILMFINELPYLCGDADGSDGVDIDDAVYLINYIFAGGPPPDPIEAGDADCSGDVDIDDVVYLVNYIFSGGNSPCDTNGDGEPDC